MGWTFDWVSSFGSDFNFDFGVSSGKDDDYGILDLVPKGRDEAGLEWPMAWVKRHDEYAK
jgi:predicted dithiol-disulfide oxidoreductase (DUF899 family)